MESRFATLNGVRLHYGEGAPNGPTLVFLTGFPDAWPDYRPLFDVLEPDYHVFAVTYRGIGQSGHAAPYRIADWVADSAAFIREIAGPAALGVGHSAGAWFGLSALGREPGLLRAFVGLDEPLDPAVHVAFHTPRKPVYGGFAKAMRAASGPEDLARRLALVPSSTGRPLGEIRSADELQAQATELFPCDPEIFAAWERDALAPWLLVPELQSWPGDYRGPLLFVYGDPAAGSLVSREARSYNQERYPWAERVEIAGAAHDLGLYDEPSRTLAEIRRFFGSLDR